MSYVLISFPVFVWLCVWFLFFFFKQKTAYEMRISDWSSDVCSSDLPTPASGVHDITELDQTWAGAAGDMVSTTGDLQVFLHALLTGQLLPPAQQRDRKSVVLGKSVSVRVDLGGRSIIKKKKQDENTMNQSNTQQTKQKT